MLVVITLSVEECKAQKGRERNGGTGEEWRAGRRDDAEANERRKEGWGEAVVLILKTLSPSGACGSYAYILGEILNTSAAVGEGRGGRLGERHRDPAECHKLH